ncbi:hypothetical protein CHH80_07230 [Bacillus sp. 7504-2]|nr:hypothetical protein CHH80_07230 [Bacillus sp. 7504-2]
MISIKSAASKLMRKYFFHYSELANPASALPVILTLAAVPYKACADCLIFLSFAMTVLPNTGQFQGLKKLARSL